MSIPNNPLTKSFYSVSISFFCLGFLLDRPFCLSLILVSSQSIQTVYNCSAQMLFGKIRILYISIHFNSTHYVIDLFLPS
uniref:Uncharacterized protein n=1 Tax=Arundo donax TaxID=35708 RepID=A0A0A9A1J5_ARUDO